MMGSRREALKRGLVLLGGVVGLGTAGRAVISGDRPRAAAQAGGPRTEQITVHGRQWHVWSN